MDTLIQTPNEDTFLTDSTEGPDAVVPSLNKEEIDNMALPSGASESTSDNGDLITEKVREEQVKLEEAARLEEEKEYKLRKEIWMKMDEDTKECRYKKLQALLQKSTMFAEYIIQRMEQQKEEEKSRRDKWLNQLAAHEKDNTKQDQSDNAQSGLDSVSETVKKPPEVKEEKKSKSTRKSLRAPVSRSQLSVPNSPALSQITSSPRTPTMYDDERLLEKEESRNDEVDSASPRSSEKENNIKAVKRNSRSNKNSPMLLQPNILASMNGSSKKRKVVEDSSTEVRQPFSSKKRKINEENVEENDKKVTKEMKEKESKKTDVKNSELEISMRRPVIAEDGTVLKPAYFTGGDLRQYQVEGLNWLTVLYLNGVNGILADEMGLGKTIQCIALVAQIITMGAKGPFMVVAPLSTLPNWSSEFKKFAPMIPVVFYHGKREEREKIRKQIAKQHSISDAIKIRPVVITSFEMTMIDKKFLQNYQWTYIIVDEGHRIKNKDCRLIRELRTYRVDHRLLLTGTPLQNNMRELWSLLNFLVPEIFNDLGSFESWFDIELISDEDADEAIIQEEQKNNILGMLHQILTPFMLRRLKTDVDLCIPPKKELLVYAPLTKDQEEFYASTVDKTILQKIEAKNNPVEEVEYGSAGRPKRWAAKRKVDYKSMVESGKDLEGSNKKKYEEDLECWVEAMVQQSKPMQQQYKAKVSQVTVRLQNIMMQLRKVCNHPYLLEYPLDAAGQYKVDEDVIKKSGKMLILDKMLPALKKEGHKVLLFSQMTKMLDVLEDYCIHKEIVYRRLDGSCGLDDRRESMDSFNTDPDVFVFLLSTKAGGLGLNLTAADTVIIYDSDWNPQNDLQAQDRCHRIGQTRPVMVYRFVTANTIDQRIVERASAKRKLEKMIILKGKFKSGMKNFKKEVKALSPEELLKLLKSKDHHGCIQQDSEVISKEELTALLDRSDIVAEYQKNLEARDSGKKTPEDKSERPEIKCKSKLFEVIDYDQGSLASLNKDE